MCGIAGVWRLSGAPVDREELLAVRETMTHRGPDGAGVWIDGAVGLAHRRLAVIDLSPNARMPMSNETGTIWAVFNGEIYNYKSLRAELQSAGHVFRTETDSEVIVHAYEEWGCDCFARFNGMFAIGVWDGERRRMVLARDPMGEKPLYYYHSPRRALLFGSTLASLCAWPDFPKEVFRRRVYEYVQFGFVRAPGTIFADTHKLPPGSYAVFDAAAARTVCYWDLKDIVLSADHRLPPADDADSIEELHELLLDAVKMRLVSDVPIGAFLSGGIDSSLIVALMARAHGTDVRTFTIGFDAKEFDESDYARQVAKHLGVDNTVEILSGDQVLRELPTVVQHCDEPMADYSILPAIAVSRMARRHITVALTGDGADELFGGYRYYVAVWAFAWYARIVPQAARSQLARLHSLSPNPGIGRMVRRSAARGTGEFFGQSGFYRGPTAGPALTAILPGDIDLSPPEEEVAEDFRSYDGLHAVERALLYDATHTLPDAWLQKVDRASMAASLEARSPFMDKRVVEAAFRLKLMLRVRPTRRKYVLRRLLSRYLPVELIERPKRGFTAPLGDWFRTDLRELATDMLSEARLKRRGYFRAAGVQAALRQTIEGRANFSQLLWALLLLEMWFDRFVEA